MSADRRQAPAGASPPGGAGPGRAARADRADRAARRHFILAHHPDRGGDPQAFGELLSAYEAQARRRPTPGADSPLVTTGTSVITSPTSAVRWSGTVTFYRRRGPLHRAFVRAEKAAARGRLTANWKVLAARLRLELAGVRRRAERAGRSRAGHRPAWQPMARWRDRAR